MSTVAVIGSWLIIGIILIGAVVLVLSLFRNKERPKARKKTLITH